MRGCTRAGRTPHHKALRGSCPSQVPRPWTHPLSSTVFRWLPPATCPCRTDSTGTLQHVSSNAARTSDCPSFSAPVHPPCAAGSREGHAWSGDRRCGNSTVRTEDKCYLLCSLSSWGGRRSSPGCPFARCRTWIGSCLVNRTSCLRQWNDDHFRMAHRCLPW